MRHLQEILEKPEQRPEPEEINNYSLDEILEAASKSSFSNLLKKVQASKTYTVELPSMLPYVEALIIEIMRQYGNDQILFAGRDAETFYDALRIVLREDPRQDNIHLFPGSSSLMNILLNGIDSNVREKFLFRQGITRTKIKNGSKYLLFDSGFMGSIGRKLRSAIQKTYDVDAKELVDIRLVCLNKDSKVAEELKTFDIDSTKARQKFPKSSVIISEFRDCYSDNLVLATALQLLPRYHGRFVGVKDDGGTYISERAISNDIDYASEINDSIVNPIAAMLVQKAVVEYFAKKRESILAQI